MDSQLIVSEAREQLEAWRSLPYPQPLVPSQVWNDHITNNLQPLQSMTAEQVIDRVTSSNVTSEPTLNTSPTFAKVIAAQHKWLRQFGHPLHKFPAYVQESSLASPSVVAMAGDRLVSAAFLYFLCITTQVQATVTKMDSVFELGSGFGGTARIVKLLNPGARIVLCDLPETLFACYVFLRRHFPHCSFDSLRRAEDWKGDARTADFTFVPAQLAQRMAGSTFDVVINTCSLSEMTQPAADWYLRLIEDGLKVDYFFHLNRIGTPEQLRNCCATSYGLDRNWEVLNWQWRGESNFYNCCYPLYPWLANVMLRRIPESIRSDVQSAAMIKTLRARLAAAKSGSDEWHAAMWDLIRLEKRSGDIRNYLNVIRPLRWREIDYYEAQLATAAA